MKTIISHFGGELPPGVSPARSLSSRLRLLGAIHQQYTARIIVATACQLVSIGMLGCSGDPTASDPILILEDGFVSGADQTEIVAEGGTITEGFNAWLKLLPHGALQLRNESDFSYQDCAEAADWFNHSMQRRELDADAAGLVCRGYSNSDFKFPNGRWYIEDRNSGYVYYRIWKSY